MTVEDAIRDSLDQVERQHAVRVLFACESGSRAWGFASADSDYDVRFLYLHAPDWYHAVDLEDKRDVIELPIDDVLDINGWDLRKALKLFRKSNPPLMEWLLSPIVYREVGPTAQRMRDLAATYYSPIGARYHYLRMAQRNLRAYLTGREVRTKKYFYVLRPLLAVMWLDRNPGMVPMAFSELVDRLVEDGELRSAIDALVLQKRKGLESDVGPRIEPISRFIEEQIVQAGDAKVSSTKGGGDAEVLNVLFRSALKEFMGELA